MTSPKIEEVRESFTEVTGAKVYYHTGVFTGVKKGVMIGAGGLALTAFVFVVLANLNVVSIPSPGMYSLYAAGGALVVGNLIFLVVLTVQHQRAKAPLEEYLEKEVDAQSGAQSFLRLDNTVYSSQLDKQFRVYLINKGQREFHLYATEELFKEHISNLKELHGANGNTTIDHVTGAKIYYHTGVFTWPKVVALGSAGAIALALGVIATLALLKVGSLGALSSTGIYGLFIAGGAIAVADIIAIVVIDYRAKAPLKQIKANDDAYHDRWGTVFRRLNNNEYDFVIATEEIGEVYKYAVLNNGQREIHFSLSRETSFEERGFIRKNKDL